LLVGVYQGGFCFIGVDEEELSESPQSLLSLASYFELFFVLLHLKIIFKKIIISLKKIV